MVALMMEVEILCDNGTEVPTVAQFDATFRFLLGLATAISD